MLVTYEQLRDNVLDRAEEEMGASSSEFVPLVQEFLDRAYLELLNRRPWLFNRSPEPLIIALDPPVEGLTLTWAAGSFAATLSASVSQGLAGWALRRTGSQADDGDYRVIRHSGASLVMEAPGPGWVAEPVMLFRYEYDLLEIVGVSTPAPSAAALAAVPGNIPAGDYEYRLTLVGQHGETGAGPIGATVVTVADPNVEGQIDVTVPTVAHPRLRGVFVFRRKVGEATFGFVAATGPGLTVRDNLATPGRPPSPLNTTVIVRHIVDIWPKDESWELTRLDPSQLRQRFSDPVSEEDPPRAYARIAQDRIRLSAYSKSRNILEVDHTQWNTPLSGSGEWEIAVPRAWRWVLADYALGLLLEQKHLERAKFWLDRFAANYELMKAEDEQALVGYDSLRRGRRHEPGR